MPAARSGHSTGLAQPVQTNAPPPTGDNHWMTLVNQGATTIPPHSHPAEPTGLAAAAAVLWDCHTSWNQHGQNALAHWLQQRAAWQR
eukprot:4813492-Prorocentrum_lima.AAC.1